MKRVNSHFSPSQFSDGPIDKIKSKLVPDIFIVGTN
jgi:hypothetical protein